MIIQNIHNSKFTQEISRKKWDKLGTRQKLFRILDETDSASLKENVITNTVKKEVLQKPEEKKPDQKKIEEPVKQQVPVTGEKDPAKNGTSNENANRPGPSSGPEKK